MLLKLFIVQARVFREIIKFTKRIVEVVHPTNEIMSFMYICESDS